MLPDQVRAFFLARGFDRAAVEAYATAYRPVGGRQFDDPAIVGQIRILMGEK